MTFHFAPAKREQVSLLIALAGASGSGKTFSALRLAKGMAPGGKIAFIDTEARRGLHYADQFEFMHTDMRPPFRPARFIEAIHDADALGAEVIVIDSFSHEHDGIGGLLEWATELEEKGLKAGGQWKEPKLAHRKLMNEILQVRASLIFCLRADEKIRIARENGKTVVEQLGWMPICEKRFMFEMTASFTLTPDRPGIPNFNLPHKLQSQHRAMFTDKHPIGEESGQALADWSRGGNPSQRPLPPRPSPAADSPGHSPTRDDASEPGEEIPSAELYAARWDETIKIATDAKKLHTLWQSQKDLRTKINWPDGEMLPALVDKVASAVKFLKEPA